MAELKESKYEKILKEPLQCLHCDKEQKNMPALKADLDAHYKKSLEKCPRPEQYRKEQNANLKAKEGEDKEVSLKRKTPDDDGGKNGTSRGSLPKKQALQSD